MSLSADEVTSVVIEFGSSAVRVGYSGEEQPRAIYSSYVGKAHTDGQYRVGDLALINSRIKQDIIQVINGPKVLDWEGFEALWKHALRTLHVQPSDHPVLLVLHPSLEERERVVKMAFSMGHPAVYLARSSVMSAFAAGRHSALVVDLGAEGTRVVPVHDGLIVMTGIQQSPIGGKAISARCIEALRPLVKGNALDTLSFEIASKEAVELHAEPSVKTRPVEVTASFRAYHQMLLMNDLKETICQLADSTFKASELEKRPKAYYEFPNGFNTSIGLERFQIPEVLFASSASVPGLADMIHACLSMCDVDLRPVLVNNIVLTGAGSLIPGLYERLSFELGRNPISNKWRIHTGSAGITGQIERRCGAWLGGSVLASLGSFQALWITEKEFRDQGPEYIAKKCP